MVLTINYIEMQLNVYFEVLQTVTFNYICKVADYCFHVAGYV